MSKLIDELKKMREHGDGNGIAEIYLNQTGKVLSVARISEFFAGQKVKSDVYCAIIDFYDNKKKVNRRKRLHIKEKNILSK